MSTTNFLDRMLEPVTASMPREFAEALVGLKADQDTQTKIDQLRTKANDGSLTDAEAAEYKDFVPPDRRVK